MSSSTASHRQREPSVRRRSSSRTKRSPSMRRSSSVRRKDVCEPLVFSMSERIGQARKKRDIVFTNELQLIVQNLGPHDAVEKEAHQDADQFIRIEKGSLLVVLYTK